MLTKQDQKFLLENLATKNDVKRIETKIDEVQQSVNDLTGAVGAIFEWTDDIHRAIVGKSVKRVHGN